VGALDRSEWQAYLDRLTAEGAGSEVTIEILDSELGDQPEAERLPLAYLSYDPKDDTVIVAVNGEDPHEPVLRHMIPHPKVLLADALPPYVPWAIDVIEADGTQTIVTAHAIVS
jgi:hypothetical protein